MKSPYLQFLLHACRLARHQQQQPTAAEMTANELRAAIASRRNFLRQGASAAAGLALAPLLGAAALPVAPPKGLRVAIIGAGVAGLHCAYVLKKLGIRATVYEASNRMGGRMHTLNNHFGEGLFTEAGGEFVDSHHADILQLCQEFGLETVDTFSDFTNANSPTKEAIHFGGQFYSEEEVIHAFGPLLPSIDADLKSCGPNFDTPDAIRLDQTDLETYIRSLNCEKWFQDFLLSAYVAEYGLDGGNQSALNFIDLIGLEDPEKFDIFGISDERYRIKGGNGQIPKALATALRDQIETGYQLERLQQKGKRCHLGFTNGQKVVADFVVLAIPFTVLRQLDLRFKGADPMKMQCIRTLGYGQNNKLIMGFRERPWRQQHNYCGFLYNEVIQTGWDSTHMQGKNQGKASYSMLHGGQTSLDFAKAVQAGNEKTKVPEATLQQWLGRLDTVFPGTAAAYTGQNYAALWSSNPFSLGSYACYRPGQWTSIAGYEKEAVGNVLFAGEHSSEEFMGYMNGAAESGRVAAEEIAALVKA